MQLEEKPAGIAEHRTDFISAPKRRRERLAILAKGL